MVSLCFPCLLIKFLPHWMPQADAHAMEAMATSVQAGWKASGEHGRHVGE